MGFGGANRHRHRAIFREDWLLLEQHRLIASLPIMASGQVLVDEMKRSCPQGGPVADYRLKMKGSIFPNPKDPTRVIAGKLISLPYYQWAPFEPPSVPEAGDDDQLQRFLDGEFYAAARL